MGIIFLVVNIITFEFASFCNREKSVDGLVVLDFITGNEKVIEIFYASISK